MMTRSFARFSGRYFAVIASLLLAACSGSGSDSPVQVPPAPPPPSPPPVNNPPTISGTPPATVTIGSSYAFTPSASDPDGDTLTFSISNQPSWTDFDPSTGALTGDAETGTAGTYPDIEISVSDGSQAASLPLFSIEVLQAAPGSVTLTWTAPTANTDGSPLTDLNGYRIYYGTSSGVYPNQVQVDNPGVTSFVIENLAPNTYYFVSTSINSVGVESEFSNEAITSVN